MPAGTARGADRRVTLVLPVYFGLLVVRSLTNAPCLPFNEGVTNPTKFQRGKPFQSKLEPVTEIIRDLRRQRKSYREIAQILRDEHGMTVDRTTIWSFVKVRSHPRRVITMADETTVVAVRRASSVADGREAIAALKAKPASVPKKLVFTYDEDKPLTLKTEKS